MNFDYLENYLENADSSPSSVTEMEGLPFLLPDPEESFSRLSLECSLYLEKEKERLAQLKKEATEFTRKKTEKHIEARSKQLGRLKKILGSFYCEKIARGISPLNPYEELLFRDWCWDTNEISEYADFLSPVSATEDHLFLGAGACGLSYQFAGKASSSNIIASDINPFLLLASHRAMNGKSVKVTDTPHFPKSLQEVSKTFSIGPKEKRANHHQVFADFTSLPFKESSFDHINATWFLDVIELSLEDSLKNIIFHLKKNGIFTYIGPSNFHKGNVSESLIHDEIVAITEKYFEKCDFELRQVNYLDSGYNSQKRNEQILFMTASGPNKELAKKFSKQEETGFKLDDKLNFKIAESQTLSQIFRHIKGDMTFKELAQNIQTEFGFEPSQAMAYARALIDKIQK